MTDPVIVTEGLTKRYGPVLAVDDLSLDVREGDVYGFLGANGSGKTTTVRMLLGLVLATSGSVEVLGRPVPRDRAAVLPQVGALVEGPAAYGHLSGRRNLALLDAAGPSPRSGPPLAGGGGGGSGSGSGSGSGGQRDGGNSNGGNSSGADHPAAGPTAFRWLPSEARGRRRRVAEALERVGLARVADRRVRAYSLGMKQRLGLAAALLRRPRLLVLDEPTNGLDPQGIHEIRTLLLELNAEGTTVFVSSHLLAEVEQLCTRVGVLDRGRLVLQDSLSALGGPTGRTLLRTPDVDAAVALLDGRVESRDADRLVVRRSDVAALTALLVGQGVRVAEIAPERRTLEQVVLSATRPGGEVAP